MSKDEKAPPKVKPHWAPDGFRAKYREVYGDMTRSPLSADNPFEQLARFWKAYPPRGQEQGLQAVNILRCMLSGSDEDRVQILNKLGAVMPK